MPRHTSPRLALAVLGTARTPRFERLIERSSVLAMVVVPALLMDSTIRFRSYKTFDLQSRRSYPVLLLVALGIALVAAQPEFMLVLMAYTYLASGFVGMAWNRLNRRPDLDDGKTDELPAKDTNAL